MGGSLARRSGSDSELRPLPRWRSTVARAEFLSSSYLRHELFKAQAVCHGAGRDGWKEGGHARWCGAGQAQHSAADPTATELSIPRSSRAESTARHAPPQHAQHVVQVGRDVRDGEGGIAADKHFWRHAIVLHECLQHQGSPRRFQQQLLSPAAAAAAAAQQQQRRLPHCPRPVSPSCLLARGAAPLMPAPLVCPGSPACIARQQNRLHPPNEAACR